MKRLPLLSNLHKVIARPGSQGPAIIASGILCLFFVIIQCQAATVADEALVDRTQIQLDFLAENLSIELRDGKVHVDSYDQILKKAPRHGDVHQHAIDKALALISSKNGRLVNEWGGEIRTDIEAGKLVISYASVPDVVCQSRLFDFSKKIPYIFKCNNIIYFAKPISV